MDHDFQIINPLCEYATEPRGLVTPRPRFCFSATVTHTGQRQTAYQILAAATEAALLRGQGDLWDSGAVPSAGGLNIPYAGAPLNTGDILYWTARIWDEKGEPTPFCRPQSLVMGLMDGQFDEDFASFVPGCGAGAVYMRNRFHLEQPAAKAVCFYSGLGYGELYVNRQKVDQSVMDPGVTDYARRYLYRTQDITRLLREGENEFLLILGHGWHGSPQFIFRCDLTLADGSGRRISSKRSASGWRSASGPITRDSIYHGETYDARLTAVFDQDDEYRKSMPAQNSLLGAGRPTPQIMEPIQVVRDIRPVALTQPAPGLFVFDLGQNIAGWARIQAAGPAGTTISLRYAEMLYEDGTVNQENLRSAQCEDQYILSGDPAGECWEPRFTYHGFRYVQVSGYPGQPTCDSLTGRVVRSAVAEAGTFDSDHALLNQIYQNIKWTEQNNLHSIPTDCPQRDERMGWLNDATVRVEGALFMFNLPLFYNKWLDDIADTQDQSGAIADTAPFGWGQRPADPVCTSYLLLAWNLYLFYGDTTAVADHYEGFKAWEACLLANSKDYIVQYSYYGDWCPPIRFTDGRSPCSTATPGRLMSTGYLYYNAVLLAKMAEILDKPDDRQYYRRLADQVKDAFNRAYFDPATSQYGTGSQSGNVFALYLGLTPAGREEAVMANVLAGVREAGGHLTTGNQCTKYLLEMLSAYGHVDTALEIATQTDYPGWGFMIANGATTIWERWENEHGSGMNSHDHPMLGSVIGWFSKYLGGIQPDWRRPAFEQFDIRPYLPRGLNRARATLKTIKGEICSAWERTANGVELTLAVPFGSEATLHLDACQGIPAPAAGILTVDGQTVPFQSKIPLAAGDHVVAIMR